MRLPGSARSNRRAHWAGCCCSQPLVVSVLGGLPARRPPVLLAALLLLAWGADVGVQRGLEARVAKPLLHARGVDPVAAFVLRGQGPGGGRVPQPLELPVPVELVLRRGGEVAGLVGPLLLRPVAREQPSVVLTVAVQRVGGEAGRDAGVGGPQPGGAPLGCLPGLERGPGPVAVQL